MKTTTEETPDRYLARVVDTLDRLDRQSIEKVAALLLETRDRGKTVFLCGNGGSGATASHIASDLIKGVSYGQESRFRAICLNDNIPTMMAYANDVDWDVVFVEPLRNMLSPGDLVIGISGSGNSMNVVNALEYAKRAGATTVAFCGYAGGKIKGLADYAVHAAIDDMEVAEDVHLIVSHCIKGLLRNSLKHPTS